MSEMPRFLRNRLILIAIVPGACGLVFNIAMILGNHKLWPAVAAFGVYVVVLLFFIWLGKGWYRRWCLRLKVSDYLLCYRCGYDLSATPQASRCPECGQPFEPETLRAKWHDWRA